MRITKKSSSQFCLLHRAHHLAKKSSSQFCLLQRTYHLAKKSSSQLSTASCASSSDSKFLRFPKCRAAAPPPPPRPSLVPPPPPRPSAVPGASGSESQGPRSPDSRGTTFSGQQRGHVLRTREELRSAVPLLSGELCYGEREGVCVCVVRNVGGGTLSGQQRGHVLRTRPVLRRGKVSGELCYGSGELCYGEGVGHGVVDAVRKEVFPGTHRERRILFPVHRFDELFFSRYT